MINSEAVSIPINPRTTRPVGYAFVDVSTSTEAERAITELKGKTILDRGISIQLARTPQEGKTNGEAGEGKPARRESGRTKSRPRARGSRKVDIYHRETRREGLTASAAKDRGGRHRCR